MADQSMREVLARLEEQVTELAAQRERHETEVGALRDEVTRLRERTRRRPRRRPRWSSRLGTALVLALVLASVPFGLLATDRFPDVPTANPHHDDVNQIAAAGITIGFPDGTYKPDAFVTRGQMASFLARTAGLGGRAPVVNAATAQTAQALTSGTATAGQVLTANGSGGAAFADLLAAAGPQGPPGPAGPAGPQGPPGPVNATSANTPNTVVQRDANGNFAAGTITGNLNGNATSATSATTATTAQNADNATQLGGQPAGAYLRSTGDMTLRYSFYNAVISNTSPQPLTFLHRGGPQTEVVPSQANQGGVRLALDRPTALFGVNLAVKSLDVCYRVSGNASIIDTRLLYGELAQGILVVERFATQASTTETCYTIAPGTPVSAPGALYLFVTMRFEGTSDRVMLDSVKLVLTPTTAGVADEPALIGGEDR